MQTATAEAHKHTSPAHRVALDPCGLMHQQLKAHPHIPPDGISPPPDKGKLFASKIQHSNSSSRTRDRFWWRINPQPLLQQFTPVSFATCFACGPSVPPLSSFCIKYHEIVPAHDHAQTWEPVYSPPEIPPWLRMWHSRLYHQFDLGKDLRETLGFPSLTARCSFTSPFPCLERSMEWLGTALTKNQCMLPSEPAFSQGAEEGMEQLESPQPDLTEEIQSARPTLMRKLSGSFNSLRDTCRQLQRNCSSTGAEGECLDLIYWIHVYKMVTKPIPKLSYDNLALKNTLQGLRLIVKFKNQQKNSQSCWTLKTIKQLPRLWLNSSLQPQVGSQISNALGKQWAHVCAELAIFLNILILQGPTA